MITYPDSFKINVDMKLIDRRIVNKLINNLMKDIKENPSKNQYYVTGDIIVYYDALCRKINIYRHEAEADAEI